MRQERRCIPIRKPPKPFRPETAGRRGPVAKPKALVHAVTVKLNADQLARFEEACEISGVSRSRGGMIAIARWYFGVFREYDAIVP